VALTDAEMTALGLGFSPLLIRPQSLIWYVPAVSAPYDVLGGSLTVVGTTEATHFRVILPAPGFVRPGLVSPTAVAASSSGIASFGLFGPLSRSRVSRHLRRWGRRFRTVAADSFDRFGDGGLGESDTEHDWTSRTAYIDPVTLLEFTTPWVLSDGRARPHMASAGVNWCYLTVGYADVKLRGRLVLAGLAFNGPGLFFRGDADGSGLVFHCYAGNAWYFSEISASGVLTTLSSLGSSPVLSGGSSYTLEVRAGGNSFSFYVDGSQVGSTQTHTSHRLGTRHGLFDGWNYNNGWEVFKVTPLWP
jgi:hypothetical protein